LTTEDGHLEIRFKSLAEFKVAPAASHLNPFTGSPLASSNPVATFTADTGYFSEQAVEELENMGMDPHFATGRQKHHEAGVLPVAGEPSVEASAKEKMQHKLFVVRHGRAKTLLPSLAASSTPGLASATRSVYRSAPIVAFALGLSCIRNSPPTFTSKARSPANTRCRVTIKDRVRYSTPWNASPPATPQKAPASGKICPSRKPSYAITRPGLASPSRMNSI
jgi:hypothetical protein